MNNDKIKLPKTYEEAVERKKEVLEIINNYNEELFAGKEPSLSDEEISLLQEEYQILDDIVIDEKEEIDEGVVEEERFYNNEIVKETKEYKKSAFDELNPLIFLYGIVMILFSSGFVIKYFGLYLFKVFSGEIPTNYQFQGLDFAKYFYYIKELGDASPFVIGLIFFAFFIALPLVLFGLDFVFRLFFRQNAITKKAFWWFIGIHFGYIVVNFIIVYFTTLKDYYAELLDFLSR